MHNFKSIAVTHKHFDISDIGKFHLDEKEWKIRLSALKESIGIDELMFLSTCNRVEFLLNTKREVDKVFVKNFIFSVYPEIKNEDAEKTISSALVFKGEKALKHLFRVASSLDSLVVGEREIITQVRNSYEACRKSGFTGDLLRIVIQKTIECAKKVYTHTNISKNPVSVVSLAYRKLRELNVKLDAKFLLVGSGVTNTAMGKYLKKHGFTDFVVFNRTLENAEKLARDISGKAFPLSDLKNHNKGFDVMVTCTGSNESVITKEIYAALVGGDKSKKVVIDLAVPNDMDEEILKNYDVNLIAVNNLQEIAKKNLLEREKELSACEKIIEQNIHEFYKEVKERKVELAMSAVPRKVKEIRETALNEVFAKEIGKLDENSKETLGKVISYLEKKYISMPMKMAKEILMDESSR
ncbi:MAG: glutamyl-tRNA reductase [Bacteroidetes bacterium]|nr:MAG: glutamyl-tRNA reductase [Bacteroidota bacterium]